METGPRASSGFSCYAAQAQDLGDSNVINNLNMKRAMYTIIHCGCGAAQSSGSSSSSGGDGEE